MENTTLTVTPHNDSTREGFMVVRTMQEGETVAKYIAESSFCPAAFKGKPGDILICMQMGLELGLKPLQAIQNIAVVNGRPSVWGDAMLAICRANPDFEYIDETYDEAAKTAICRAKRKNEPEVVRKFSELDATAAGLLGKPGPWKNYPLRMLQMRARGFALRDCFTDSLRGIFSREETEDIMAERVDYSGLGGNVVEGQVLSARISDEQLRVIREKLAECKRDEAKLCVHLKIDGLQEMTVSQWYEMIRIFDAAIVKQLKEKSMPINRAFETTLDVDPETGEVLPPELQGGQQ